MATTAMHKCPESMQWRRHHITARGVKLSSYCLLSRLSPTQQSLPFCVPGQWVRPTAGGVLDSLY